MPLRKASAVTIFEMRRSSSTISTMRAPQADAIRTCAESAAGIDEAPVSVNPMASTMEVMVEAVPMVLQVPIERVMLDSSSIKSSAVIFPRRYSSQYFFVWVPAPVLTPRHCPLDIGPAGQKIVGSPMLIAPISSPGTDLSQPPSSTTPSMGCERNNSSVSIARKLQYSMVVGLTITSPTDIAGNSTG